MPPDHLIDCCTGRDHGEHILFAFDPEVHDKRTIAVKCRPECGHDITRGFHFHAINTVGIGDLDKLNGRKFGE